MTACASCGTRSVEGRIQRGKVAGTKKACEREGARLHGKTRAWLPSTRQVPDTAAQLRVRLQRRSQSLIQRRHGHVCGRSTSPANTVRHGDAHGRSNASSAHLAWIGNAHQRTVSPANTLIRRRAPEDKVFSAHVDLRMYTREQRL